ncbi:MAG: nucleotide exchange factor GrpE [Candidatus Zambryskibacteria bacterium RIFCSPHIGHO2_12_FULL_48_10]|uniref:Protein GrpE n=1 Tax=Candidatus Zambryskibacteria bacterium RIFCSPHIGHO2_01_FULL_46_25 TaxID=1802738 RepID=A0A1G2T088_9BACT|nr:MAG: Protein GrpE [Parcubacteria group bacterium GW2011_GWA1_47_10]OHA90249.1 MAG: nucleotide exchange factor GrpE [Candidatus Zambryskibacteria bacterium RIFCSPHIGHO2_01_FULL_46_25]OHB02596.1 MAG: nucleotide exchange factor GrpE [Candidatus Zambryskibacteria bacterium RIFCSPHIGHO2_12_FULL_48_10]OHB06787.1 MAG: nucleotide exchange factor GrpE [Candidatus Zambryskibacteria bacterium RIFCSPLOWO2_01_FULL_48_25]
MDPKNDDFSIESTDLDDSVIAEEHASESIQKLRAKLKEAEGKAKEYLDGWQRAQADFVNIRKRDDEAKNEFLKFANSDLIYQLMPVLDSLELSLPHDNKELEAVYKQLLSILKSNGLEESNPMGMEFDPRLHESIGTLPAETGEDDHKILEVAQKGYILSGKIIRPAKVKIGEFNGK